jgi:hypothetical protein
MISINDFEKWKTNYPDFMTKYVVQEEGPRWGRVMCIWQEVKPGQSKVQHIYAASIDLQNGDIYLDCRKRKLWVKCCLYSLVQPIFFTVKTVYHLLLPISVPFEIYHTLQTARKQQKVTGIMLTKKIFKNIGKNIADIVRTPLYALVLTMVGIAGVLIGPLAPKTLYHIRMTIGKLERSLNWGVEHNSWNLFRCLHRIDNLTKIDWRYVHDYDNTEYIHDNESKKIEQTLHGLTNLAYLLINFRRENSRLFNDCFRTYPMNKPYISASTRQSFLENWKAEAGKQT